MAEGQTGGASEATEAGASGVGLTPPPSVDPRDRPYWLGMMVAGFVATAVHIGMVPMFASLGATGLAWFNLGSVVVWTASVALLSRGRLVVGTAIGVAEVSVHAAVATAALGTGLGFHYYLLASVLVLLLRGRRAFKLAGVVGPLSLLLGLLVAERLGAFPPSPKGTIPAVIHAVNLLALAVTVGVTLVIYTRYAHRMEDALATEHARSEALLHNILPAPIAARLKAEEGTIADTFEECTILFADLANFTPLSASMDAETLVGILNRVFTAIDELAAAHGLEKIKTIGDAYMVAAGVPVPREDHARAAADFALAIVGVVDDLNEELGSDLAMRVGVHSGLVVAGVIGKSKFSYDVWGDTVNTASRMESHGAAGRVHVSAETAGRLSGEFVLTDRGEIEVKGKGPMRTYFLERRR